LFCKYLSTGKNSIELLFIKDNLIEMRIEEELKLDYSDVLFRPKRSTLKSRKDVNLLRTYRFKYSKNEWSGIPIMAAIWMVLER